MALKYQWKMLWGNANTARWL